MHFSAFLLQGFLLFLLSPSRAQRLRDQSNGRFANGPPSLPPGLFYASTSSAAASMFVSSGTTVATSLTTTSTASTSTTTNISSGFTSISTSVSISTSLSSSSRASSVTELPSISTSSVVSTTSSTLSIPTTSILDRRAAIPACLNSVEASCYNLASNCIDEVNWGNRNHIWGIQSCVAAATCYGVGDLISSINCQTGFSLDNADEENLDYNIYATIVGSCAWDPNGCPITAQNYIDFYYFTLTLINTEVWPSDGNVVLGLWSPILSWAATGTTIPYTNFNDWLLYSTFPPAPTTASISWHKRAILDNTLVQITHQPPTTYTAIPWNPNPAPPPGATSQTFILSETTLVIAVPTITVTVTVAGATITVAPGGTPVNGMVPTDVTQPGAVTPTFNFNPIPPATASSVTFVSGTWTSIVAAPTSSDEPVTITGPPDDGDDNDSNDSWILSLGLLGLFFLGSVPSTVAVIGAATPAPTPPIDWPDPSDWVPPPPPLGSGHSDPDPDDDDDDDDDDDGNPEVCFALPPFTLLDGDGTPEEELRRRKLDLGEYKNVTTRSGRLSKRSRRRIKLGNCPDPSHTYERTDFTMGAANWYTLDPPPGPNLPNANTNIHVTGGATHIVGRDDKIKEHIFEFHFIKDFVNEQFDTQANGDCTWLEDNLWESTQPNQELTKHTLFSAIDHPDNCVWVDQVINRAKSSVTDNTTPARSAIESLNTLASTEKGNQIEMLIRTFGMLGQYFTLNANAFFATANKIQNALANITPTTPIYPPLDVRFNSYLRETMSQYSNRITSRGVNTLDYYRERMNIILQEAINNTPPGDPLPTVPQCLAVYHDATIRNRLQNAGLNWQNLVPPAIPHPVCNVAGQTGSFILYYDQITGLPVTYVNNPVFQIVALGTRFSGMMHPASQRIFYDVDLAQTYGPTCTGIHWLTLGAYGAPMSPSYRLATLDQDCPPVTGPGLSNLHPVDVNGNRMVCLFNNFNDGSHRFAIDCGPSQNAVQTCIAHINMVDGVLNGYSSNPFQRFQGW